MTCLSARNIISGDNSKHGSGILVGRITITSGDGKRALASGTVMILGRFLRIGEDELVKEKIDYQFDVLTAFLDSIVEKGRPPRLKPATS